MDMSTLNVRDVRTFIGAKDFDASRDFYLALGWTQTYDADDLRVLQLGGHRFYLQNYYQKDWCENTMLHISVDDVEAWFAFQQRKATIYGFEIAATGKASSLKRVKALFPFLLETPIEPLRVDGLFNPPVVTSMVACKCRMTCV